MIGRHQSELETPALCVDLAALTQRIDGVACAVRRARRLWRPRADWHLIPEISRMQMLAGAHGISLESPGQAERFLVSGISSIHVSRPPIGSRKLWQLIQDSTITQLTTTCDHYAQAEAISSTAIQQGVRVRVLVELNSGLNCSGVRPGPDGRDLVRGLSRLPGVDVCGLSTNLGFLAVSSPAEERRIQSAIGLLAELRAQMVRDGIHCGVVSVEAEGDVQQLLNNHGINEVMTELRTGNHFEQADGQTPVLKVIASVFSRSKLERAVLDMGRSYLPGSKQAPMLSVNRTAMGRPLVDVRIAAVGWESTTLELSPGSFDLVIGDKVEVEPGDGSLALRLFRQVYAVRDGIIVDIWN